MVKFSSSPKFQIEKQKKTDSKTSSQIIAKSDENPNKSFESQKIRKKITKRKNQIKILNQIPKSQEEKILKIPLISGPKCRKHFLPIDFICTVNNCAKELCSHCILEHKEHIGDIMTVKSIIKKISCYFSNLEIDEIKEDIICNQKKSLEILDNFYEKLINCLNKKINEIKDSLITDDERKYEHLNSIILYKEYFDDKKNITSEKREKKQINKYSLELLKKCLKSKSIKSEKLSQPHIEEKIILKKLNQLLTNNLNYYKKNKNFNTTNIGIKKYLHWFAWEKRELHLFNVTENIHKLIKLVIPFKIPPFSRSIQIPCGKIFLLGGECSNEGAKNSVYYYNLNELNFDKTLHLKKPMPLKKYDFALCHNKGHIYVLCGKIVCKTVVNNCEKYNIKTDSWSEIAPSIKKRYAASCSICQDSQKIYLFGGRSESANLMINEIEEYDIGSDSWKIVHLKNEGVWRPIEICASIQVRSNQIIVFGGSDHDVKDSKECYVFDCESFEIRKIGGLRKPNVFVFVPFLYGNNVYAIGNEYYVKRKTIHRFDIRKMEWEIVL